MSTLAIGGSSQAGGEQRPSPLLRYADLLLGAAAAAVFVIFGFPLLGYAVGAGAWLAARGIGLVAERHTQRALAEGRRRSALGTLAAAMLGRVWLLALAVLIVGLADRKAGLAAAVLCVALFTVYLGAQGISHVLGDEERR